MDALHIAMAEEGNANYFITCDDEIVTMAKKNQKRLKVKVCSLLEFLEEVIHHAKNNS